MGVAIEVRRADRRPNGSRATRPSVKPGRAAARAGLACALLAGGVPAASGSPPDLSGAWRLDPRRSDDARSRIEAAAGPGQVKSGGATGLKVLPEPGTVREVERVELRQRLLALARQFERLEIRHEPDRIRLYHGDEGVRIFYFGREHVREDGRGRKLKCRTRWQGEQLVLEEESEDGRTRWTEVLTLVPAAGQLLHVHRFESPLLDAPIDVRLVYLPDAEASPPR